MAPLIWLVEGRHQAVHAGCETERDPHILGVSSEDLSELLCYLVFIGHPLAVSPAAIRIGLPLIHDLDYRIFDPLGHRPQLMS